MLRFDIGIHVPCFRKDHDAKCPGKCIPVRSLHPGDMVSTLLHRPYQRFKPTGDHRMFVAGGILLYGNFKASRR